MKIKTFIILFVFSLCLSAVSCITVRHPNKHHKEMPPGHKKKIHNKKQAKYFAPRHYKPKHKP